MMSERAPTDMRQGSERADIGEQMYGLIRALYPICRSITGDGVRETLRQIARHIPLDVHEVPSGTRVFDWTVPKEWNVRDAWIKDPAGNKIVDFRRSNLHLLNYSIPVNKRVSLAELRSHLFTLPEHPHWIPYKTSYYQERWGFCISHNQLLALKEGLYEVVIDADLAPGHLTYGEFYLAGARADEVLISCHTCHPSLCNDNLSGVALCTFLAKHFCRQPLRYSYRFIFIPGTIGAITWLALNEEATKRIRHGLVAANVGDPGKMNYKKSRRGDAEIDRAVAHALRHSGSPYEIVDFSPDGYDERQFCSPAFNLAVGCLTRTPHGCYPQYHSSADDLDLVQPGHLADSFRTYISVLQTLEDNRYYLNQDPKCEPQLGRRGLYRTLGGHVNREEAELALLWVLNLCDGRHSLLDIAERSKLAFSTVSSAARELEAAGLLQAMHGAGEQGQ